MTVAVNAFPTYTPTIVAANPSFLTPTEKEFWRSFQTICAERGWRLVKAAARKIEADADTLVVPTRLCDVAKQLRGGSSVGLSRPPRGRLRLPAWLAEEHFYQYVEWELRRWRLPETDAHLVMAGLTTLVRYVDEIFTQLRPAACLTTNKIEHGTGLFRSAALHYGVEALVVERSPIDNIWIESIGIFAESEMWQDWPKRDRSQDPYWYGVGQRVSRYLASNPDGLRPQHLSGGTTQAQIRGLRRPLFFLPMDNVLWTGWAQTGHPQRDIDYPIGLDPIEAISLLSECVEAHGGTLVVKLHPACTAFNRREFPERVRIVQGDLQTLLKDADVVAAFNTKVAFPAVALGKPTITLAPNPIGAADATYHVAIPSRLPGAVEQALAGHRFAEKLDRFFTFLGWLQQRFFYDAQQTPDFSRRNQFLLMDRIEAAVRNKPVGSDLRTGSAMDHLQAITKGDAVWSSRKAPARDIIKVDFDVSRLVATNLWNFGISRYTRELFSLLGADSRLQVEAVIPDEGVLKGEFKNNLAGFSALVGSDVQVLRNRDRRERWDRILFSPCGPLPTRNTMHYPRVLVVHDCLHLTRPSLYTDQDPNGRMYRTLSSLDLVRDLVICDSAYTLRDLLRMVPISPAQACVVPLAASPEFAQVNERVSHTVLTLNNLHANNYFVMLAQNDPRKNLGTAVKAIASAYRERSLDNLTVVFIISSGQSPAPLLELLEEKQIPSANTRILTALDDRELAAVYQNARFALFVPLYEGFGLPPLEAMSAGCPVIVSATSSLPEVVGDAGMYVDPTNVTAIQDAILAFARNDSLGTVYSERGRQRAAQFSWARTATLVTEVLSQAWQVRESVAAKPAWSQAHMRTSGLGERDVSTLFGRPEAILFEEHNHQKAGSRKPYADILDDIRDVAVTALPRNARVAVISKGDPELLDLSGPEGWHFPQRPDGVYAGHHPEHAAEVIRHLEEVRIKGAEFLLIPQTAFWWLEYYEEFKRYLDQGYRRIWASDSCVLYRMSAASKDDAGSSSRVATSFVQTPVVFRESQNVLKQ